MIGSYLLTFSFFFVVFSLGLILYELICGFEVQRTLKDVALGIVPPLPDHSLHAWWNVVYSQTTEYDAEKRSTTSQLIQLINNPPLPNENHK